MTGFVESDNPSAQPVFVLTAELNIQSTFEFIASFPSISLGNHYNFPDDIFEIIGN